MVLPNALKPVFPMGGFSYVYQQPEMAEVCISTTRCTVMRVPSF
jgi:hypothetical protein|uniref:Uncharacterized protein n=1 Tax=Picea glauca TaxID=3330 RepID=A0A117NGM0_PICGL|nr:hypothetical protein ABT39_MTgene5961 [Picea glauca]